MGCCRSKCCGCCKTCSSYANYSTYTFKNFEDIKSQLRPLDLVFFAGNDLISKSIKEGENLTLGDGDFSHVGILINRRMLTNLQGINDDDQLFVWESTFSSSPESSGTLSSIEVDVGKVAGGNSVVGDVESKGELTFGVQIRSLEDLAVYSTTQTPIGWGKLIKSPLDRLPEELDQDYSNRISTLKEKLLDLHKQYYRRPFQVDPVYFCAALRGCCCLRYVRDTCCSCNSIKKNIFCSEFVSIVLKTIGILPNHVDPRDITPVDLLYPHEYEDDPSRSFPQIVNRPIILNKYTKKK